MRLFDTHMHLDDSQFEGQQDAIVERARDAGLVGIVAVGTSLASSRRAVALADKYDLVYAAVGIQPNSTHEAADEDWRQVEQLATHPDVVAIGETGLDHYWDFAPLELQRDYFARHIRLGATIGKPLVIHMREAAPGTPPPCPWSCSEDIWRCLQQHQAGAVIMHSYTGDAAMAERFCQRGAWISFAGMVTYKKSTSLREVARTIPDDQLLIETDSPYLSPHPHRGQRPNEPALVRYTAECLAEVRGVTCEALAELTTRNAMRAFQL